MSVMLSVAIYNPESTYFLYFITGIVLLPGVLFAAIASASVKTTFNKYNKVPASAGITAARMAREILSRAGLDHISVVQVSGTLTDYYSHSEKRIALSDAVYNSTSVGALGVAAHECGHAIQYSKNYLPVKIRAALVPVVNFSSTLLWPILIVGITLGLTDTSTFLGQILLFVAIAFFGMSILFSLFTLPTELDASRRANAILVDIGALTKEESRGAKRVLRAAASTYVAALVNAILNLLRILLVFFLSSRRKR